ncbi:integrase core domain-containing protein [Streptomyces sp. NPDC052109]|uniref:integrase core domain-containing protein n=1 Tax=Streptomyces sp. NPDC052109 TaxID=3155527 RepID=UPI0034330D37
MASPWPGSRETYAQKQARIGYDYVHGAVDDHSRRAYAEIDADESITDNAWTYPKSTAFRQAVADLGAEHGFIRPHCPWTNGKVERFNPTLQTEWAYRQVFTSNTERDHSLAPCRQYAWVAGQAVKRASSAL